jgi:hypothetical protein
MKTAGAAAGVILQILSCFNPTIIPIVAGPQNQPASSTIYFLCTGLSSSPALMGINCPGNISIPASALPGQSMHPHRENLKLEFTLWVRE